MPIEFMNISFLMFAMFIIVALTNVIVEVIKTSISNPHPNVLALITSVIITEILLFAYCSIKTISIVWYTVVGALIFGILCSYIAMTNFDKFWKLIKKAGVPVDSNISNSLDNIENMGKDLENKVESVIKK